MDGSDNGDREPPRNRLEYQRNVRAAMEERRQAAATLSKQFHPDVMQQINRLSQDYEPPLYARLRGQGKNTYIHTTYHTLMGLSIAVRRPPSDLESEAVVEHTRSRMNNFALWKWGMTGLAGYLAWRTRATFRFPFVQPQFTGRWSPVGANVRTRQLWHACRFMAYYGVTWVVGDSLFVAVESMRMTSTIKNDDRLAALRATLQGRSLPFEEPQGQSYEAGTFESFEQPTTAVSSQQGEYREARQPVPAQNSWSTSQGSREDNSSDDVLSEIDDASPVTPAARNQRNTAYPGGGSAWERIRHQAGPPSNQAEPQGESSWDRAQTNNTWGGDSGTSPEYRGPRESFSYSKNDEEKSVAKEQAQKEFDELLERERNGEAQQRKSWGRK